MSKEREFTEEEKQFIEAGRFAILNPDILHTPSMMREIICGLLWIIRPGVHISTKSAKVIKIDDSPSSRLGWTGDENNQL